MKDVKNTISKTVCEVGAKSGICKKGKIILLGHMIVTGGLVATTIILSLKQRKKNRELQNEIALGVVMASIINDGANRKTNKIHKKTHKKQSV